MQLASDIILLAVVATAAVTDLRTGRIHNALVYPAIVLGMLLGWLDGGRSGLEDHALGAGVAFGIMLFCYLIGGVGGGDVKLMAALGALGGWVRPGEGNFVLYVFFYTFAVGATMGLVAALWKRALGVMAVRTWWGVRMLAMTGTSLDEAVPATVVRVPFGLAAAIAVVWVLAENYAGGTLGSLIERVL